MRNKQNIILLLVLLVFLFNTRIFAQNEIQKTGSVYKINRKVELPLTLGLFGASLFGFEYLRNKPTLSLEEVSGYQQNDIWWFDRSAVKQDVSFRNRAHDISDFFLNSSVLLPFVLALDNDIRKDWVDLLILYGESHAINTDIYLLNTSFMLRSRPFTYNPYILMNDKLATETRNSFFSGHVSSAATATFFAAKVYSDYHPEIGNKKYWLYVSIGSKQRPNARVYRKPFTTRSWPEKAPVALPRGRYCNRWSAADQY